MTINMVSCSIFLLGTWILLRVLFPQLFLDYFRDKMFKIRNELFDFVLSKNITSFDSEAYRTMEFLINSLIHYAEKIKPSLVFSVAFCGRQEMLEEVKKEKKTFNDTFNTLFSKLNEDEEKVFRDLWKKIEWNVGVYLILSSWTTILLSFCLCSILIIFYLFEIIIHRIFNTSKGLVDFVRINFFNTVQCIEVSALLSK